MRVDVVGEEFALGMLRTRLNSSHDEPLILLSATAEYVRVLVEGAYARGQSIHTSQITSALLRAYSRLWERVEARGLRLTTSTTQPVNWPLELLHALQTLGDIYHIGNGRWTPTPSRLVEIGGATDFMMVVGSDSNDFLSGEFGADVSSVGIVRTVSRAALSARGTEGHLPVQRGGDWLGASGIDLKEWTKRLLRVADAKMAAGSSEELTNCEIYTTAAKTKRGDQSRWAKLAALRTPPSGIALCRSLKRSADGYRPYWLIRCEMVRGQVRISKTYELRSNDRIRTIYGFDALGEQRGLRMFTDGEILRFSMRRQFPKPEGNILAAGWINTVHPRCEEGFRVYDFDARLLPLLVWLLEKLYLKVNIQEVKELP